MNTALAGLFFILLLIGAGYFLFRRRTFDLFAIAFGGAAFYFFPLLIGFTPDWNGKDPFATDIPLSTGTYVVGLLFTSATIVSATLYDSVAPQSKVPRDQSSSLANWYIGMALVGLFGSATSGSIMDLNKTLVLTQLGYWFVLFETAAAMAWIDALFYRRRAQLIVATLLLVVDIAIGFRTMTVMCFLAFLLIELGSRGKTKLWRSIPFIALATTVTFFFLLTINNVREIVLPHFGVKYTKISPEKMKTIQATLGAPVESPRSLPSQPPWNPIEAKSVGQLLSDVVLRVPGLLWQLEPFVTQAILSETTRHDFRCEVPQVRNIALLVPFVGRRIVGPPITFESQYKPVLFPNNWAGMAGNAWAEAYCDFASPGIAAEIILVVLLIATAQLLMVRLSSSAIPALLLSGAFLAFYVHRNDMLYELLLIRRAVMVFVLALACSSLVRHVRGKSHKSEQVVRPAST